MTSSSWSPKRPVISLAIPVEAFAFASPPAARLHVDWNDLAWAAITVGRPNRYYVFKHGRSSAYEAIFRASLLRMALEESTGGTRYSRTPACKALDPSEKGAVNYFLGLTLCKAFAEHELSVPWLWHLDVFRNTLNPQLYSAERSRPDLVGEQSNGDWIAFEAKGRVSPPDTKTKQKAKEQAERVVRVMGKPVTGHYAGISYFKKDTLSFFVQDPEPVSENSPRAITLKGEESDLFRTYYLPFVALMRSLTGRPDKSSDGVVRVHSEEIDADVGMRAELFELAAREQWAEMRRVCLALGSQKELARSETHADGLWLRAGRSWHKRITQSNTHFTNDE